MGDSLQVFKGVSYRTDLKKPMNPERSAEDLTREADIGTLTVGPDAIEFTAPGKAAVRIRQVHSIVLGKRMMWRYAEVTYGDGVVPKVAYFGGPLRLIMALVKRGQTAAFLAALQEFARTHTQENAAVRPEAQALTTTIGKVVTYAVQLDAQGESPSNIEGRLASATMPSTAVHTIITNIKNYRRRRSIGIIQLLLGGGMFIIGALGAI
ncbi:MAG: hypothetical protein JW910_02960, partial [Anaerolineae bacterium]|nr:hypothetical protein [Anaerolineae bacterium]